MNTFRVSNFILVKKKKHTSNYHQKPFVRKHKKLSVFVLLTIIFRPISGPHFVITMAKCSTFSRSQHAQCSSNFADKLERKKKRKKKKSASRRDVLWYGSSSTNPDMVE